MTKEIKNVPIVSSDDDMEEPMTKDYSKKEESQMAIFIKQEFIDALKSTIGNLGYDRLVGSPENNVKVSQIFEIANNLLGIPMSEDQANKFVGMIALSPYNVIHTVMENIKTNQSMYFEFKKVFVEKKD